MTVRRSEAAIENNFPERQLVRSGRGSELTALLPGLALTFGIAALVFAIRHLAGIALISPLILAIIIGMVVRNSVGAPSSIKPGVAFSLKRVLRLAIILLGLQLTLAQIAAVGPTGIAIIVATLVLTFLLTKMAGRALGVDRKLAELIAAGTAVCGASAVIATNTVTGGSEEDVAYAVACVTVFGSLSMILFPLLAGAVALDPAAYGLWTGASIHEVAQVVAAAFQGGEAAGQFGTIAKLSRVMMLAPLILVLGFFAARRMDPANGAGRQGQAPVPWFVFGFIALVAINSAVAISPAVLEATAAVTSFLLSAALAAMGLETDVRKLRAKGARPLLLGAVAWLVVSLSGLALIKLSGF